MLLHKRMIVRTGFFIAMLCMLGWAITGKVVDGSGAAVPDAMITYNDLAYRLFWAYSDASGNFNLPDPQSTAIHPSSSLMNINPINPFVVGNTLVFNATSKKVTIAVFSLCGREIGYKEYSFPQTGVYSCRPFNTIAPHAGNAVYIVKIHSGNLAASIRMINLGMNTGIAKVCKTPLGSSGNASVTATIRAGQIRVGKTGFNPTLVNYTNFNDNVGTVAIATIDIEAKVDSLINVIKGKANKIDILLGQCCMARESFINDIVAFNAGAMYYDIGNSQSYAGRRDHSNQAQNNAMTNSATHVPVPLVVGADIVHGYIYASDGGVVFPHNIGLGCTFDTVIVQKCYRVAGIEARGAGVNWSFGPTCDVVRNDKHGRTYEGFSEDPMHSAMMARAAILGFQGTDLSHPYSIAAAVKHFAGAGGTQDGIHKGNANTGTDAVLRAIHLEPYKAAISVGVASVMAAFNSWLGIPMHAHTELMENTLKGTMGFDGFIVGDWNAHWDANGYHQFTTDVNMQLAVACINAGLDVPMSPSFTGENDFPKAAKKAYDAGKLTEERITETARRLLRIKFRMGLFTEEQFSSDLTALIKSDLHKDVAREAVRKSLVCLKNAEISGNRVLPLSKTANIHIVGNWADNMGMQSGGWTLGWQGDTRVDSPQGNSIKEAIDNACSGNITYSALNNTAIPSNADVVVVVIGEIPYSEDFGDHKRMAWGGFTGVYNNILPSVVLSDTPQGNLINTVTASTSKPVLAILVSGRPMVLGTSIDNADAFVCAWLPGTEGSGVADVLFGDFDFTGKLSFSWPTNLADEPLNKGNYGDTSTGTTPLFDFGFGLNLAGQQIP